jgi:FtsP/CotA-like multicopper oxidase with cupredoxin domain
MLVRSRSGIDVFRWPYRTYVWHCRILEHEDNEMTRPSKRMEDYGWHRAF